ncbi:hypothetical protein HRD49_36725 [Corallococcus exiguus]|uniref:hypothetical protein n=1 Tax=Corallococcus exiguus TaxID=83462 RepID=UPI00155F55D0|nr:hypothetical protein [Corallococcus exiguus]NRD67299.1 hypothetical protein [Corallococcus exiguus]
MASKRKPSISQLAKDAGRPPEGMEDLLDGLPLDMRLYMKTTGMEEAFSTEIYERRRVPAELREVRARMRKLEKKHGLKPEEFWPLAEAPDEVEVLRIEEDAIHERAFLAFIRAAGEHELAQLRESHRAEYDSLVSRGMTKVLRMLKPGSERVVRDLAAVERAIKRRRAQLKRDGLI